MVQLDWLNSLFIYNFKLNDHIYGNEYLCLRVRCLFSPSFSAFFSFFCSLSSYEYDMFCCCCCYCYNNSSGMARKRICGLFSTCNAFQFKYRRAKVKTPTAFHNIRRIFCLHSVLLLLFLYSPAIIFTTGQPEKLVDIGITHALAESSKPLIDYTQRSSTERGWEETTS